MRKNRTVAPQPKREMLESQYHIILSHVHVRSMLSPVRLSVVCRL